MKLPTYKVYPILLAVIMAVSACEKEYESIDVVDSKNVDAYIDKNNLDVQEYNNTGIFYKITQAPTGSALAYSQEVPILYTVRTLGGEFSAVDTFSNRSADFLGYLNPEGLRVGVKEILKNSRGEIRLIIPSRLAFGRNGNGSVPGNASLDFTIKVLDKALIPKYDDAVIKSYLQKNNLTGFTKTATGLYYKISAAGTGIPVLPESRIVVKYNGKLLNGTSFDSNEAYNALLEDLIEGWQEGLPLLKEGGKIRLFVPSALAYGFKNSGPIPAFSCLDFEIEVTKVYP